MGQLKLSVYATGALSRRVVGVPGPAGPIGPIGPVGPGVPGAPGAPGVPGGPCWPVGPGVFEPVPIGVTTTCPGAYSYSLQ